ncbi:hypothetical protein, partial [Curtobacterium sp. MCPF17_051]|uniref:hypothetical protein n=1 Tax=Curtobacterium sp. MCPF17_051 TaxID=2175640 RepID=UPI001C64C69A
MGIDRRCTSRSTSGLSEHARASSACASIDDARVVRQVDRRETGAAAPTKLQQAQATLDGYHAAFG